MLGFVNKGGEKVYVRFCLTRREKVCVKFCLTRGARGRRCMLGFV